MKDDVAEAYELIRDLNPGSPQEYILKAVVNAALGQQMDPPSQEHLKMARSFFQLVGASASECDTIPGRQCMASCFFLLKQFEDVNIYLNSIKAYLYVSATSMAPARCRPHWYPLLLPASTGASGLRQVV